MQTIFTVGQVAKICKVAPRTVSKWFDSGRLRGYRIPGSQDRRIPREHLIRFLKEHGMPLGELEDESLIKVLLVLCDGFTRRELEAASNGEFKVAAAASGFEAGIIIESDVPDCVVIYFSHREALTIAAQIKRNPNLVDTSIIGLVYGVEELSDAERSVLTAVCSQKFGKTELAECIRTLYRGSKSYRG